VLKVVHDLIGIDDHFCIDAAGKRQGPFLSLDSDGVVREGGTFSDDRKVGLWVRIRTRSVRGATPYVDGQITGLYRSWYPGQIIESEQYYVNGEYHGEDRHYYPDGTLELQGFWDNGLEDGTWTQWAQDGRVLGTFDFDKGTGVRRSWHQNGQLASQEASYHGITYGYREKWDEQGQLVERSWWNECHEQWVERYVPGEEPKAECVFDCIGSLRRPGDDCWAYCVGGQRLLPRTLEKVKAGWFGEVPKEE
jgi:hypothetical protein